MRVRVNGKWFDIKTAHELADAVIAAFGYGEFDIEEGYSIDQDVKLYSVISYPGNKLLGLIHIATQDISKFADMMNGAEQQNDGFIV